MTTMTEHRCDQRRLDEVIGAIMHKSTLLAAGHDSERHIVLERRWREIGGMLELARRLGEHRLVRALEAHKDALRRLIETL
jgi:aryl carrier-like protein